VLIKKLRDAIGVYNPKTVLLGGGVLANSVFRSTLEEMVLQFQGSFLYPHLAYCSDNAVMIGVVAALIPHFFPANQVKANPTLGF
jgi:N6-L-threonylcarbamoyladenine synthase